MNFKQYQKQYQALWHQPATFEAMALALFRWQAQHVPPYAAWVQQLGIVPQQVEQVSQIPFLPIRFFKSQKVLSSQLTHQRVFNSSGTTGQQPSSHYIAHPNFYLRNCQLNFEAHYGPLSQYVLLAVLPNYQQQPNSSLIYMIDFFIKSTQHPLSGYYLQQPQQLAQAVAQAQSTGKKVLVWGVTYALADLAQQTQAPLDLSNTTVIETGGMKGRRAELTRPQLHQILKKGLNNPLLGSEYGMAELCSQAYAAADGLFKLPPTMRFYVRDITDPFNIKTQGRGRLNIIDIANYGSCAFIETEDLVETQSPQQGYQILGRLDGSEQRGCSLLTA